jgi:hypothetical protein
VSTAVACERRFGSADGVFEPGIAVEPGRPEALAEATGVTEAL